MLSTQKQLSGRSQESVLTRSSTSLHPCLSGTLPRICGPLHPVIVRFALRVEETCIGSRSGPPSSDMSCNRPASSTAQVRVWHLKTKILRAAHPQGSQELSPHTLRSRIAFLAIRVFKELHCVTASSMVPAPTTIQRAAALQYKSVSVDTRS